MNRRRWLAFTSTLLTAVAARAQQHAGSRAALPATAPAPEAAQFDFLVGHWELEVKPKVGSLAALMHGTPRLLGSWKAWRAFDGFGVEDELRIVDASGNPMSLTHSQRIWDGKSLHWRVQTLDVYRARFAASTAQWQDGEMRASGSGTGSDGKVTLSRARFHDIAATSFRWRQDRSADNGASWDDAVLTIAARRVAAKAPR